MRVVGYSNLRSPEWVGRNYPERVTMTADEYLAQFDNQTLDRLQQLRRWTTELAPTAHEGVGYGLLTYKLHGRPLIHYGGFAKHIGVYPTGDPLDDFAERLSGYRRGKGSIQFPLGDPVPADLLRDLIAHRVQVVGAQLPPIGRPATAALAGVGITGWSDLAGHTADELLALHGVGPKAITILNSHGANL